MVVACPINKGLERAKRKIQCLQVSGNLCIDMRYISFRTSLLLSRNLRVSINRSSVSLNSMTGMCIDGNGFIGSFISGLFSGATFQLPVSSKVQIFSSLSSPGQVDPRAPSLVPPDRLDYQRQGPRLQRRHGLQS